MYNIEEIQQQVFILVEISDAFVSVVVFIEYFKLNPICHKKPLKSS
jgi:hypothetical protein